MSHFLLHYKRHSCELSDFKVFWKELEDLEYFADMPNIVQAAGFAISTNPCMAFKE
ncbi:hypothetical protein BDV11DRAFT_199059 [Aspergillus similis]